jgi:hypothetical protein
MKSSDDHEDGSKKMKFDAIVDYQMNELETRAYTLSLIWHERARKMFPNYSHQKIKKSGDPRTGLIFKICYKLVRETQGLLEETDYTLYVRAQLDVLRHVNEGKRDPLISPNCLVGDKAWKRWKLWKRKFDEAMAKPMENNQSTPAGVLKALHGLEQTREFLFKNLGPNPSYEKFQEAVLTKNLFKWINFGKISPYYIAISPFMKEILKTEDLKKINFDPKLYEPCITKEVRDKFKIMFPQEKE